MRIMMITEKDAANHSLTYIADAFIARKHNVDIYAPYDSANALKMFNPTIPVYPIHTVSHALAKSYDCIFASTFLCHTLRQLNLLNLDQYIFTYDFLFHGDLVNRMDFGFSPSIHTNMSPYKECLDFPLLGIGEPRFDHIDSSSMRQKSDQILFIDSGHYPFGREGKVELAKTLLAMARNYPDYRFVVKPRFLPSDEVVTHGNRCHLYGVLASEANGPIPDNLDILMEYRNLEDLINESRTIICMYTTAYISALVAGKGLIILDGLPNEDNCDLRTKRLLQTRRGMLPTGALIDYRNAIQCLPDGVPPNPEHLHREVACLKGVSDHIVQAVEDIVCRHICLGQYPVSGDYADPQSIAYSTGESWEQIKYRRLANSVKYFLLTKLDYYIDAAIEVGDYGHIVDECARRLMAGTLSPSHFARSISQWQNKAIVENESRMLANSVDRSMLLQAYHQIGLDERILTFSDTNSGAYHYHAGLVCFKRNDFDAARRHLEAYLEISSPREFKKEVTDNDQSRAKACSLLSQIYKRLGKLEESNHYSERSRKCQPDSAPGRPRSSGDIRKKLYATCLARLDEATDAQIGESILRRLGECPIVLYGAGTLAEQALARIDGLQQRIAFIVDQSDFGSTLYGKSVFHPDELSKHPEIKTVVVTVPHLHDEIVASLLKIRKNLQVLNLINVLEA